MHIPSFKTFPPHHQPTSSPLGAQTPAAPRAGTIQTVKKPPPPWPVASQGRFVAPQSQMSLISVAMTRQRWISVIGLGCPVVPLPRIPVTFLDYSDIFRDPMDFNLNTFISPLGFLGGLVPKGLRLRLKKKCHECFSPKKHQSIFLSSKLFPR